MAPTPVAWLAMGFRIDDRFAERVQSLTALDVSFWSVAPGGEWKALASTLPSAVTSELGGALARADRRESGHVMMHVGEEDYVTAISTAQTGDRHLIATVLQKSLREELAPLRELQTTLLVLGLISLFGTVVASVLIADQCRYAASRFPTAVPAAELANPGQRPRRPAAAQLPSRSGPGTGRSANAATVWSA